MRVARTFGIATALLLSLVITGPADPVSADSGSQQIPLAGTGIPVAGEAAPSDDALLAIEQPGSAEDEGSPSFGGTIGRSLSRGGGKGIAATAGKKAKSNPEVNTSFEGLNFYQQRFSRKGNQFSVEPPDQALCVGNGFVVEAVNVVMNIYNAAGASVLPDNTSTNTVGGFPRNVNHSVDLNSFYGYPAAIDRSVVPNKRGPTLTDPSCYFDAQTQRFFMVVLTLDRNARGGLNLNNHLDIAVTQTSNPTGTWNIYKVPVTNDGSHNPDPANACPCLGDFPHVGADANGFYITTNAYPFRGNGFNGAQIYAFSKAQLAAGAASVTMVHIDTFGTVNLPSDAGATQPGFTVWPAQSPGTDSFELGAGGTEYFLSSNAADESTRPVSGAGGPGASNTVIAWALTNTASLNSVPALTLSNLVLPVNLYGMPPKAKQPGSGTPPGASVPQGKCINDTTTVLFNGQVGCWRLIFNVEPAHDEVVSRLDSSDTRMLQVSFANGKIWGALDTAVTIGAENRAGVAYYIVKPDVSTGTLAAKVAFQGTVGLAGTDLIYPTIGVTASGRGVMALTLVGENDNPSAAYAAIDAQVGLGDVHVIAAGAAPDDGFTSYKSQVGFPPRTRWGDYGAAAVDGNSIWIASEYIAQACDYTAWGGPFFAGGTGDNLLGTCGGASHGPGKRAALGNWSTRITKLTP